MFAEAAPGERIFWVISRAGNEKALEDDAVGVFAVEVGSLDLALNHTALLEGVVYSFFVLFMTGMANLGLDVSVFHDEDFLMLDGRMNC